MATSVATVVGSIVETSSDGSISIPNTTAPTAGDLLVAFIGAYASGGTNSIGSTPSGWTAGAAQTGDEEVCAVFYKVADSGDVSAGNFPFTTTGGADVFSGVILKVTNYAVSAGVSTEVDTLDGGTDFSYTTNLAATTPNSLVLAMYMGSDGNGSVISIGGYASTPSLTWSELVELQGDNGSPVMTLSVASANNTGTGTITNRAATGTFNDGRDSIIVVVNTREDAQGTNALLEVSPFFPAQNGVAGATGTNTLHTATPEFFDQSGKGTSPTQWTNEPKPSTTWENETL